MNRRGFLGALVGLPAAAAVTSAAPLAPRTLSGLEAWIPVEPPASAFFGIDRSMPPHFIEAIQRNADAIADCLEIARTPVLFVPIGWQEIATD